MALPFDHDADDALAALSLPTELTPGGHSRRRFLAGLGAAGVAGLFAGPLVGARPARAQTGGDRNLVVLLLGGGNDGFATVMPRGDSALRQLRPSLLVKPTQLLDLGDGFGLHPSLPFLHSRFQAGEVALVGGVGASGSLSHFTSMGEWMAGAGDPGAAAVSGTGWVGRWLDTLGSGAETPLRATSLTGRVPRLLVGRTSGGAGIAAGAAPFGSSRRNIMETGLFGMVEQWGAAAAGSSGADLVARNAGLAATIAPRVTNVVGNPVPTGLGADGVVAGRLLNTPSLGCRVVFTSIGTFDHHTNLVAGQAAKLRQVDAVLEALFTTLTADAASRTSVLVFSEFGRRPAANGSAGSDHGTANYAFVVGPPVRGGTYGAHLDPTHLDGIGNPYRTVSHLDLVGSVLRWVGTDPDAVVGTATTDLGLFR